MADGKTEKLTTYVASDGVEVALSARRVARYILTGNTQVPDKDIMSFMAKCKARKLNPFAGDAYMTAYKDKQGRISTSVIVSKDYFVRTAAQQPTFDGMKAGIVVITKDGVLAYREGSMLLDGEQLQGGWADVYDKERKFPSHAEVSFKEYTKGRSTWLQLPATMIRKVALVQALREAYPACYGGIYDAAEMPEPEIEIEAPEPVEVEANVQESVAEVATETVEEQTGEVVADAEQDIEF